MPMLPDCWVADVAHEIESDADSVSGQFAFEWITRELQTLLNEFLLRDAIETAALRLRLRIAEAGKLAAEQKIVARDWEGARCSLVTYSCGHQVRVLGGSDEYPHDPVCFQCVEAGCV